MGVRDPGSYPKFLCGRKRLVEISQIFVCSQCRLKNSVALDENTRSSYHIDLELSDRSRE